MVFRYTSTGALDTSFGDGNGYVVPPSAPCALAIDANGDIEVDGGYSVTCYTSSGALDTSFGNDGTANLTMTGDEFQANAMWQFG